MKRFVSGLLFGFSLLAAVSCAPKAEGITDAEPIDIREDPLQRPLPPGDPICLNAGGYTITIRPQAEYRLRGIVLGRKNYGSDWNSAVSPCDLAVAWGKMTVTGLYLKVDWSQSGRWYYWRYDDEFPFDNAFIARYSANTHAIPANQNVRAALLGIEAGDTVCADGFLVYVYASKGTDNYWWNSSLSREDAGDGSCEVMYINELRYRGKIYR